MNATQTNLDRARRPCQPAAMPSESPLDHHEPRVHRGLPYDAQIYSHLPAHPVTSHTSSSLVMTSMTISKCDAPQAPIGTPCALAIMNQLLRSLTLAAFAISLRTADGCQHTLRPNL
eukprot:scaffold93653_cov27-Tisochrysis_lutea.AAC.3